jgi:hypothetical protein
MWENSSTVGGSVHQDDPVDSHMDEVLGTGTQEESFLANPLLTPPLSPQNDMSSELEYVQSNSLSHPAVLYTPPYVLVDSVQTMRSPCGVRTDSSYSNTSEQSPYRLRADSTRTPHGLCSDIYIAIKYIFTKT